MSGLFALLLTSASGLSPILAGPGEPQAAWSERYTQVSENVKRLVLDFDFDAAESLATQFLDETETRHGQAALETAEALDLALDATRLWAKHVPAAEEMARRAVAIKTAILPPEDARLGKSLRNLARVQVGRGAAEARSTFERALVIQEKALGPKHAELAETLHWFGRYLATKRDFVGARAALERALVIRETALGTKHVAVASTLSQLGRLCFMQGDMLPEARERFARALSILEEAGGSNPAMIGALTNLSLALGDLGLYAEALPYLERALAMVEAMDPWRPGRSFRQTNLQADYLNLLRNATWVHLQMGDYGAARFCGERAVAEAEKIRGREDPNYSGGLWHLCLVLVKAGDYAEARPALRSLLSWAREERGPESEAVANVLRELGHLELRSGNLERADSLLACAQRVYAAVEESLAVGPDRAGQRNVPQHTQSFNLEHDECQRYHGEVLLALGEHEKATRVLEQSFAWQRQSLPEGNPFTGETLVRLGAASAMAGDEERARDLYSEGMASLERACGERNPLLARSLADFSSVLERLGEPEAAFETALRAERLGREHLRGLIRSVHEQQALRFAAARAAGLDKVLSFAARHPDVASSRAALDAVVRARSLVLDEIAARHRVLKDADDAETAALLVALAQVCTRYSNLTVAGPAGGSSGEHYRNVIDTTEKEKERIERALAARSTEFRAELAARQVGLDGVMAVMPPRTALVSFVRSSSYMAFVSHAGQPDPVLVTLGSTAGIEALVRDWEREVSSPPKKSRAEELQAEARYRDAAEKLRAAVWDPVSEHLAAAELVFVVPDGVLHLVNFASFPTGEKAYLVERNATIHYLAAERDLLQEAPSSASGFLALGGADYEDASTFASLSGERPRDEALGQAGGTVYRGARSSCGTFRSLTFHPIPGSRREVEELSSLWSKAVGAEESASMLAGPKATEAAFKRLASQNRVVHVATHGFFLDGECVSVLDAQRGIGGVTSPASGPQASMSNASKPHEGTTMNPSAGENPLLLSGLALAGANRRHAAGPGEEDGILTAEEIAALDLSNVEWAVLSACETGVGEVKSGEGVFGLRRAFQVAGARSLIMSLWGVEDESTRRWMHELYEARFARGGTTAAAVRGASLAILRARRERGESTHPFYWGAFVAAGDWR